jgi:glycine/D-amino acid oxidase-like deaminating enzyme
MTTETPSTTWTVDVSKKSYPAFTGNHAADVVVIGGGITGVVSAYLLAKAGKKVIVLDKGTIGSGTTSYTTAFLTQSLDTDPADLIKAFGEDKARVIIASHGDAIKLVETIVRKEKISCDFMRCSNYVYANSEKEFKSLHDLSETSKSLGLETRVVSDGSNLGFKNCGYMEIQNQAKFHPLKFMFAVADRAEKLGAKFFERSEVLKTETQSGASRTDGVDRTEKVITENGTITARHVIVATYAPYDNPASLYLKKGTYLSYVLELDVKNMRLLDGTFEDTQNPYHYMRIDEADNGKGQRVVIGGEDHRQDFHTDETKSFNALVEYADTIIPHKNRTITKKWIGTMLEPTDGLPCIGTIDDRNVLYTLAFSGNGMTYSSIAAMIFRDMILVEKNALAEIYDPKRHITAASLAIKGRDYAGEAIGGAVKNTFTQNKKPKS